MPRVSVLFIDDAVVGPRLRLLRQVCEPTSSSKPHVTVRYFERLKVPEEYRRTEVNYIDLIEPGTFKPQTNGTDPSQGDGSQTVFIRCKSDHLAPLEHKPHFPGSDFHVTIYDGKSKRFARKLLVELQKFRWNLRVPLSDHAHLTVKDVNSARRRPSAGVAEYDPELKALFREIAPEELTRSRLASLSERERLRLCRAILQSLFRAAQDFERVSSRKIASPRQQSHTPTPDLPEVHLTPPELARDIAEFAISQIEKRDEPIHFGDPAVGTGAFYAALLQLPSKERPASAIGVDINSHQVAAARWRWSDKGMQVLSGDYLHMNRLPRRTLILANPPYLRHQSIPPSYKRQLLERASVRTDIRINARSGLYVYFMLLAHDWMSEGAVAAWLVPSAFMGSAYGAAVRQYLTEKVELIRVHVYGQDAPQFENATVSPAVVVFRNRTPHPNLSVVLTSGGGLYNPERRETVALKDLRSSRNWTVPFSRTAEDAGQPRIGDLFVVRRGIATGANNFFIMTRSEAKTKGIPKVALRPLIPKVRALGTEIVESEPDGYPTVSPQLCLIDCDLPESAIRSRYPRLMKYLSTAKGLGVLDRRLVKDRHPWYKQEHRDPPPFFCTYMGRGTQGRPPLQFIWNKSQAIATNTYLMLYPRPRLAHILSQSPAFLGELFSILQQAAANGVRERARVHAGGLLKIEPRDLSDVRLPIGPTSPLYAAREQPRLFP